MLESQQPKILNNRFQLERRLGRGGMATVYLAQDLQLRRPVAIKLLHNQYASDEQFLRRFKHEAESAARLNHPNIVRIFDVGQDGEQNYIVMEYIDGADLKQVIELEAPLSIARTLRIIQQIAEALEVAHRAGMVHRDVKPQNVLVDQQDQIHLSDFGIAKSDRSSAYTDPGTTFGTADYLAPEQAQGLGATPRSDIYALGVVTYELLTGRLPFTGDTPLAVAMQHVQAPPPPPRQFNPQIPGQLEAIILQALNKDPENRPATARQFADMLRSYQDSGNQPTAAQPVVRPVPQTPSAPRQAPRPTPAAPDATTKLNPDRPRRQTVPANPTPRRQPMNVPPPIPAPQPTYQEEPRRAIGCGTFVMGILLLAGIGGLLYVLLFTDLVATIQQAMGDSATETPTQPTPSPAPELGVVPQLLGLSEADALRVIAENGFAERRAEPRFDAAPRAHVIEQAFPEGTQLAKGSIITITLSLGPEQVTMPATTGRSVDEVAAELQALGLTVDRQDVPSADVPANTVMQQNPAPGTLIDKGSAVQLQISLGDVIAFPDIIGKSRAEAVQIINESPDLILDVIDEQGPQEIPNFDQIPPNTVVSATANGAPTENGRFVPRGSRIVLGVRQP